MNKSHNHAGRILKRFGWRGSAAQFIHPHSVNKTSYTTRFSYAASDVAGQLVFTFIIGGYLSKFFTDIYGLSAVRNHHRRGPVDCCD